jgi:hypothetical protein
MSSPDRNELRIGQQLQQQHHHSPATAAVADRPIARLSIDTETLTNTHTNNNNHINNPHTHNTHTTHPTHTHTNQNGNQTIPNNTTTTNTHLQPPVKIESGVRCFGEGYLTTTHPPTVALCRRTVARMVEVLLADDGTQVLGLDEQGKRVKRAGRGMIGVVGGS